jgi:hypothetical protein
VVAVASAEADVRAAPLVRPWWRRARAWLVLLVVLVLGAILVGTLSSQPGRPLDPRSSLHDGSKALARLLAGYGAPVTATSSLATAVADGHDAAVLVTDPDDYSSAQLGRLAAASARLVLVQPDTRAAAAVSPSLQPDPSASVSDEPACADPGARAAGRVTLPDDAVAYLGSGFTSCYRGALVTSPRLAVLGSPALLRDDHLADDGVAALDINAITDSRRLTSVVWLLPGSDAAGSGPASIWDLFPGGAYRVFWWLIAIGVLVVLWRARRLGGVVTEPLPVVVRSAEVVEGHGRLYARAGARDRAAAALRSATVHRLGARLNLPRGTPPDQVAAVVAPQVGRPVADVTAVLAGPPPSDDAGLLRLAQELDHLETSVR